MIRSNYDTLTLKLQENLDHYEKYSEKPKEAAYFTQLVCVAQRKLQTPRVLNSSLHLARKHARIFIRRHYLFRVSFEEQIMSKDNCPSIFSRQIREVEISITQLVD